MQQIVSTRGLPLFLSANKKRRRLDLEAFSESQFHPKVFLWWGCLAGLPRRLMMSDGRFCTVAVREQS